MNDRPARHPEQLEPTIVPLADDIRLPPPVPEVGGRAWKLSHARNEVDLHNVGRFRYAEHVVRLQKPALHADHERALLLEPLDVHSTIIAALADSGGVIGSVRVTLRPNFADMVPWMLPAIANEPQEESSYVSRLLVAHSYRGSAVAKQLFIAAFEYGASRGIKHCYIYCAPGLVKYYERWGFIRLGSVVCHPDDGEQVPMRLDIRNFLHLEHVRSPFRRHTTALPMSTATDQIPASKTCVLREPCG